MQITLKYKVKLEFVMQFPRSKMAFSLLASVAFSMAAHTDEPLPHPLAFMFGEWVGPASGQTPSGAFQIMQTERVGTMLDGDAVVIEGRGYNDTGETMFNAFAVVSQTGLDQSWEMRSYARGRAGTFPFELTDTGYVWSLPAGPNARMIYTATFEGDTWRQVGAYTPNDGEPRQTFQMTLTRVGGTDWPAGNPVSPRADE